MSAITDEIYWQREIVTIELDWLADTLCERTGRPRTAAGTKGNEAHRRGGHRSQEWILKSAYCTNRTYTVQPGLTAEQLRHIGAIDFTPGSAEQMIQQCKRLDAALRAGLLEEITEFYGNLGGDQVVDGWDNIRNRTATSDSSHLWHWHLTFNRTQLRNRALMERILNIVMGVTVVDVALTAAQDQRSKAVDRRMRALQRGETTPYLVDWTADPADKEAMWAAGQLAKIDGLVVGVAALTKAIGGDLVDEAAIASAVLAGLAKRTAEETAAALRAVLSPEQVTALAAALSVPAA